MSRYYTLSDPVHLNTRNISRKWTLVIILSILGLALFWCIMPVLGWSRYSLEGSLTTCSVEWSERSLNVTSYNLAIFAFVFFIPLGLIIMSKILLFKKVWNFHISLVCLPTEKILYWFSIILIHLRSDDCHKYNNLMIYVVK